MTDSRRVDLHDDGDDDTINVRFEFGSIVAAKVGRFPYWPAMIDPCPETGDVFWLQDFNNLAKKNASHYHVVFFDEPGRVTRSWVHTSKIRHFVNHFPTNVTAEELEAAKKLKESAQQRRLIEARRTAEDALKLCVEDRKEKFSFIQTYQGRITLFDDDGNKKVIEKKPSTSVSSLSEPAKPNKKNGPKKRKNSDSSVDWGSKSTDTGAGVVQKANRRRDSVTSQNRDSSSDPLPAKTRKKPGPKPKARTSTSQSNLETPVDTMANTSDEIFVGGRYPRRESKTYEKRIRDSSSDSLVNTSDASVRTRYPRRESTASVKKYSSPDSLVNTPDTSASVIQRRFPRRYSKTCEIRDSSPDSSPTPLNPVKPRKKPGPKPKQANVESNDLPGPPMKKRGRKPKNKPAPSDTLDSLTCNWTEPGTTRSTTSTSPTLSPPSCVSPKRKRNSKNKRGRKANDAPAPATVIPVPLAPDTYVPDVPDTYVPDVPDTYVPDPVTDEPVPTEPDNDVCIVRSSPVEIMDPVLETVVIDDDSPPATPSSSVHSKEPLPKEVPGSMFDPLQAGSENTMVTQINTFLSRVRNDSGMLPKANGKTISNLNLLVKKTEETDVVDLTLDDDGCCEFVHGDVVFANLKDMKPWPALITYDPQINLCFIPETEPNFIHVFFFLLCQRAWVPAENVAAFDGDKTLKKSDPSYQKFLKAAALAEQALKLRNEERVARFVQNTEEVAI